jgi:hypothetical protein
MSGTIQNYHDEEHGVVQFIDKNEVTHSAKCHPRDIRIQTKTEGGRAKYMSLQKRIANDINEGRNT